MIRSKLLIISLFLLCASDLASQQLTLDRAVMQSGFQPAAPAVSWSVRPGFFLRINGTDLVESPFRNGKESILFSKDGFNEMIATAGFNPLPAPVLPTVVGERYRFLLPDGALEFDPQKRTVTASVGLPQNSLNTFYSPDFTQVAYTDSQNVFIKGSGPAIRITSDTEPGIVNGHSVSRDEFGISGGLFWSPASRYIAFYRKDERAVPLYPLVNTATTPGSLNPVRYPMAGGPSETIELGIYRLQDGAMTWIREEDSGPNCYLTQITWDPAERYIYIAVLNRDQNHLKLNQYEVATGRKIRTLFEEKSSRYVEPLQGMFFNPADPEQFVWFSEKDGFDHLYLYRSDGSLVRQLTRGDFVVTDFLGWDDRGRYLWFRSTEESPLERHIYRLDLSTGVKVRLTPDAGTHDVTISPDKKFLIDSWSSYVVPRRVSIRDMSATQLKLLFDAPDPLAGTQLGTYKSFTIKSADKSTDLYGYLVLPPNLDPNKKYPVIIYVYGGPHAQLVVNRWMGGASGWQHYMALQGYVCMTLDNRGSDGRGRDFEQVIHRNLGKAEMADQMEGVNYLMNLPYVDGSRIGVHGWSYGGFMTTSLMLNHPDVFKVGVAGGPVIDWKFYEVMYGERYMDRPEENPEGYQLSSTLGHVRNLRGRLMLIHGDQDATVVMQNSLTFLKKCVDEGKLVDFMVYPGHPHNVRGKDRIHLMKTVTRYFSENL